MTQVEIRTHKEMMSILRYCSITDPSHELTAIMQGLYIDHSGVPIHECLFAKWQKTVAKMLEKNIRDVVVAFLAQLMKDYNMEHLSKTISLIQSLPQDKIKYLQDVKVNYWNLSDIVVDSDYKFMLKILDYVYSQTNNDDLGALMGSLSTDVLTDNLPADLADYEVWLDSVDLLKNQDIVTKIVGFLEHFSAEFSTYNLESTIQFVKSLTDNQIRQIMYSAK